jgi:hypothetical protein
MKRNLIKPNSKDQFPKYDNLGKTVFLAGSIEQGQAEDWQTAITDNLLADLQVDFFNPRRDSWDISWNSDDTRFSKQVNWELDHLQDADLIFFYFSPGTQSPISLLELGNQLGRLGMMASDKLIVCCPDDFWRAGNVQIICSRYGVPVYTEFSDAVAELRKRIES